MPNQSERYYDYHYDSDDPYVYEGTHVLINKFGITDYNELSRIERMITGATMASLEANPLQGRFDLAHLQAIHKFLFGEIYDWAGQIRKKGFISKGTSLFCKAEFIESYASDLFLLLKQERFLVDLNCHTFAERVSYYIAEINAMHPFREGNGRTQRVFINQLAKQAGWDLNFTSIEPDVLCDVYIASMKDCNPLIDLLKNTITPL